MKEQTNQLRRTPLPSVMQAAGCNPDRHDKARWHTSKGVVSITGMKFFNWILGIGGGGAIDLVMHLFEMNFSQALAWLCGRFPSSHSKDQNHQKPESPLTLPEPNAHKYANVTDYLVNQRCITAELVNSLIESDNLYADNYANAVFIMRGVGKTPVGAELRGTGQALWRGMAPGSRKNLGFFSVRSNTFKAIIICESAIDAMSCFLLHPSSWCVSTAGARSNITWLPNLLQCNCPIYCGFDNDHTGLAMTHSITLQHPRIMPMHPQLHDWNDTLKASL